MASRAPCSALTAICLFRSGGPRPISCPCVSWGASRVPRWNCYGATGRGGELCQSSVVCVMCSRLLCPYLVCFLSLLSVILVNSVQLCLSHYLWLSCVFIFLSVQFDFSWSTRYSPVFLSVSILPCPALPVIKDSSACSSILTHVCAVTITT